MNWALVVICVSLKLVGGSIPVRYDGTQLWRIPNVQGFDEQLTSSLEDNFGGDIWESNPKFVDVAVNPRQVRSVHSYLDNLNLTYSVMHEDIQKLIDSEENYERKGLRFKKAVTSGNGANVSFTWTKYHSLNVIYKYMDSVRNEFPNLCQLYSIGKSYEGRKLLVLKISEPTENEEEKEIIWIDGGIHAREWISPAVVTYIVEYFVRNWQNLPDSIRSKAWYVMPVMNPDGYVYSRQYNRLWRKTRSKNGGECRGVDLNRNFDISWNGRGSSANTCSDIYRGPTPFSEPESKAVANFLKNVKDRLVSYLTFHSYGQLLVYPWAYKRGFADDAGDLQEAGDEAVNNVLKATGVRYTSSVTHRVLGVAGGGSDDWTKAALGTKYVYTIELRDTGFYGFVLPPSQIIPTSIEGLEIVKTIAKYAYKIKY